MKTITYILIYLLSISLYSDELRVAVVGEPEELRLKVEAGLFQSPFCKVIELNKRKETLNEIKSMPVGDIIPRWCLGIRYQEFKIGEALSFEVISSEDGYLTLIDIWPDGSIVQLLPNK